MCTLMLYVLVDVCVQYVDVVCVLCWWMWMLMYVDVVCCRLLVGAPFEHSGDQQTGDVYRCPLDPHTDANCTRLNLGIQPWIHAGIL